jgi:hydrogenase maturation protein HypF
VKEPRRVALALLYELFGEAAFSMAELAPVAAFSTAELGLLRTMLARNLNSPLTSSVGRLFDAVASLAGLRQQVRFEGQAAMELEFALEGVTTAEAYDLPIGPEHAPRTTLHAPLSLDWSPMVKTILADLKRGLPISQISAQFHNALAESIIAVAQQVGQPRVVLSGGCFQNRYLTERSVQRLQEAGFHPYWHQRVPPNDGGISLGQVVAALRQTQPVRFEA